MNTADAILKDGLRKLVDGKRRQLRVDGWFYLQELRMRERETMRRGGTDPDDPAAAGELLCRLAEKMTLSIPEGSALAGTQDDAFSPSYALINPAFRVQSFAATATRWRSTTTSSRRRSFRRSGSRRCAVTTAKHRSSATSKPYTAVRDADFRSRLLHGAGDRAHDPGYAADPLRRARSVPETRARRAAMRRSCAGPEKPC